MSAFRWMLNRHGSFKIWVVILMSVLMTMLSLIPGMGLPGGVMLVIGSTVLQLAVGWFGFPTLYTLPGSDYAWGAAILMTLSLAPFLPIAYVLAFRRYHQSSRRTQWKVWALILLLWSTACSAIILYQVANAPAPDYSQFYRKSLQIDP
ncbi:MAG: hypothetical protein ABL890_04040 [Candidatus Peribacteraceae bacterium]